MIILELDKCLIVNAFTILGDENTEYTILIAINIYNIGINKLSIKFVIK